VAAALISKPETICLDEPTTGLDATNALHLIQRIRRLCTEIHMTAVASLHQCRREIMLELDMVILMAHGCIIYSGPQKEVLSFVEPGACCEWPFGISRTVRVCTRSNVSVDGSLGER
jgi:ABC-type multidrug transport system ATPase subunit